MQCGRCGKRESIWPDAALCGECTDHLDEVGGRRGPKMPDYDRVMAEREANIAARGGPPPPRPLAPWRTNQPTEGTTQ